MAPTALLTDAVSPENDARSCVLLPLLIVASSVVKEVIAAGPGTVVVVEGATVVVVEGATVDVVEVLVVEVEVVAVGAAVVVVVEVLVVEVEVVAVGTTIVVVVVLVVVGTTVIEVVVGTTDVEVVVSSVATVVDMGVSVTVVRLAEGVVPDSTVEAEIKGVFIAAVISLETNIAVFVKPLGHIAIVRQRICRELNLVQIGRTPFSAFFDALVVLATHLPEREYFNALLVVMQTVFAVSAFHVTFDSDRPQVPVFVTVRRT
jgi:hypothetical protein